MKLGDKLKEKPKPVLGNPGLGILTSLGDEDIDVNKNEIDINLLDFNDLNFYNQVDDEEDIRELAESISEIGLLHNIVVKPNDKGRYTIISGEKRTKAFRLLFEETKDSKWKQIPCKIRDDIKSAADEELTLIKANRDVRERNDLLKAKEVERLDAIYESKKAAGEKVGIVRKRIAEDLNISETQVQRLRSVNELIPEFKDMLAKGDIQLTTVEHFTGFDEDTQKDIFESIQSIGHKISREEAQEIKSEVKAIIENTSEASATNVNTKLHAEKEVIESSEPNTAAANLHDNNAGNSANTNGPGKNNRVKDTVTRAKANVDISQHIKKVLSSVKSMVSKIEELSQSKKKLSAENIAAINSIKDILDNISI